MKKIIILLLLFVNIICSAQNLDTDALNNPDNIFIFSLKIYCSTLDTIENTVYVIDDGNIGSFFPEKINKFTIVILRDDNIAKIIKKNNGITAVRIGNLQYINNQFSVGIIPFGATMKGDSINLVNGGGLSVYFEYDCIHQKFIYKSNEFWGI